MTTLHINFFSIKESGVGATFYLEYASFHRQASFSISMDEMLLPAWLQ